VVDSSRWSPAAVSRYCRGHFHWDLETSPAGESVNFLLDVRKKIGPKPILIPTTDAAALFVAKHTVALRDAYLFPDQSPETAFALANKDSMFHLARRCGVPTPDTFFPKSRADVLSFLETATPPLMLKALDYNLLHRRCSAEGKQIANSRSEVLAHYDLMQDPEQPNLILQEYVPGGDDTVWMFNGYFNRDSKCLFGMTGRKLRQSPVYTGSTCLGVCLQNDQVLASVLHFMKAVSYRGILDIGYRYDARDGQYKVLDVNPRIGSTFRLFAGNDDMDVARALYLDLTGQTVPPSSPRYGRKWIVEDSDVVSSIRYFRAGKLTFRDWLRSFQGIQETAFLSLGDPAPVAAVALSDMRELAVRIFARRRGVSASTVHATGLPSPPASSAD